MRPDDDDARNATLHIGSITHRPLDTATLPTSVRLADAMTITGIDSTGQSAGGNVLPAGQLIGADDLDAELRALDGAAGVAAPVSAVPDVEEAPEQQREPVGRRRAWLGPIWRDVVATMTWRST